ncbi:hypothetical protein B0T25DRAFT_119600 [Lasiosphaeria hispida]|uniref:Uncharacterized protein n=1 Tax=Lasiosphaeria hispida TaxID=260671 RepID=A0AAJ0HRF0_9PEZI|nr:hypothetical protein B0T25DRAFT_119600 [Lasiosphaeria hispida]
MIWDFAVRPDQPGAHFFTVLNKRHEDELAVMKEHSVLRQSPVLAAPRGCRDNEHSYSWTASSNPSAYMVDSGLWTACRTSRERIDT